MVMITDYVWSKKTPLKIGESASRPVSSSAQKAALVRSLLLGLQGHTHICLVFAVGLVTHGMQSH